MSNSDGSYRSTRERSMAAYDKLPPLVRQRLSTMSHAYATQPILTKYRNRLKSGMWPSDAEADVVKLLDGWEATDHEEHYYRLDRAVTKGTPYEAQVRRRRKKQ